MTNQRCYKTIKDTSFRNTINKMRSTGSPAYVCSIETTGLNSYDNEIICIDVIKCHFEGTDLIRDGEKRFLCKPENPLSEEIENISGITNEMLSAAPDVETMMNEFVSAIGSSPNIIGFNIIDFCSPFFKMAGFNSGYMPDLSSAIDLMSIAKATLPLGSYKLKTICKALGINETNCLPSVVSSKANMKFEVFKQICSLVPAGTEVAEILDMKYWKKSYNCRFIYVYTNFGKVAFNCKTLYWQECDDGFFDVVDLDKLSLTICQTYNCANMFEFAKKYEAKQA